MHILILTLVLNRSLPAAMTTAEFSGRETCEQAAATWKMQAKIMFGNALVTAVCVPK